MSLRKHMLSGVAAALIASVPSWATAGTERGLLSGYEINASWDEVSVQAATRSASEWMAGGAGTPAYMTGATEDGRIAADAPDDAGGEMKSSQPMDLSVTSIDPVLLAMDAVEQRPLLKPIEPPPVTPTVDEPWDGARGVVLGLKVRY